MIDYRHKIVNLSKKYPDDYESISQRMLGFEHSGLNLVDEVNALNPNLVVDVGCGVNYFKNKITNLIGFDVVDYPGVDFVCAVEDMSVVPGSVDVALALGSLQYTTRQQVHKDLSKIVSWLRPGGLIVVRNRQFVSESESAHSEYGYRWSQQWFEKIGSDFGLHVVKGPLIDTNTNVPGIERIVWWWQKS
jgi:hypothetical protein